ncbi:MAG: hypothetical protein OEV36_03930 [Myxococcales bacterium]|nr:hypothetical protein [Myxococcales bacterium]
MKTLLAIAAVVVVASVFVSDADADNVNGTCNAIVATDLGAAQACENMSCVPGDPVCMAVTNALIEFVSTPGCVEAFANGELNGLPGNASVQPGGPNAGALKHIQDVICGAVEDCGLCPSALTFGICVTGCAD